MAELWFLNNMEEPPRVKIWNPKYAWMGPEQKYLGFVNTSLGGTFAPKMNKIDFIKVFSSWDFTFNQGEVQAESNLLNALSN